MANDKSAKMGKDMSTQDREAFVKLVKSNLSNVKTKVANIRQTDTILFVTNIIAPAIATLIAALAAAIGGNQMFAQAAAQANDGGWKLACILAAVFSFIASVSGMFKKQFDDRLTLGNQCVGRLLSLDLAITTGKGDWEEAAKEYGEILKAFPEFVS